MAEYVRCLIVSVFVFSGFLGSAQNFLNSGQISGNFQTDVQYYQEDSLIGAPVVPEKVMMNAFANINYTNGPFSAGLRFESYLNALQGFDPRYKGSGIPYKYASFEKDFIAVTLGSYYEQFGNGLILRAYEERSLGIDNALEGVRVKVMPAPGITLKGIYGQQRFFFDKGPGIVRGGDAEFSLNDIFGKLENSKLRIIAGGSFVSKYQKDEDPVYKLPENVAAFAGRAGIGLPGWMLSGEYVYKINDPSADNNRIYRDGQALMLQLTYTRKSLGASIAAKRIDNMSFRSNRDATGNVLHINYLPALTRQHAYSLFAMYPYASQPNGEAGIQAQLVYSVKKGSKLGGKYGTTIALNYSRANAIAKKQINPETPIDSTGTLGYTSGIFDIGKEVFFEDANIEITRKFSKRLKAIAGFAYIVYNTTVIEGHEEPVVYANVAVADLTYYLSSNHALRFEVQHLYSKQDEGSWIMGLLEYTIAPKWSFTIMDMYDYGNSIKEKRLHYYTAATAFAMGSTRIALSYGLQNDGILCVGGVCRYVPASNGFSLSLTSSF